MPKRIDTELPAAPAIPIEWPKVIIGGYELEVRHSFATVYRASKAGVDFTRLNGSSGIGERMDLFAIMVAPLFEAEGEPAPSGIEWAAMIGADQTRDAMEQYKAISAAIDKAYELAKPKKAAAGTLTPQTEVQGNEPN